MCITRLGFVHGVYLVPPYQGSPFPIQVGERYLPPVDGCLEAETCLFPRLLLRPQNAEGTNQPRGSHSACGCVCLVRLTAQSTGCHFDWNHCYFSFSSLLLLEVVLSTVFTCTCPNLFQHGAIKKDDKPAHL